MTFHEVGERWGFRSPVTYGAVGRNTSILESTGAGVAILDYDGDGRNDVLVLGGARLSGDHATTQSLHLFRQEEPGQFRPVDDAGLSRSGWAQSVCAADYDNDGRIDLLVSYYGQNRLFRNTGGKFEDVTEAAGLPVTGTRWGSGCAWLDYDRDGSLDLFVANYVDLDLATAPKPGSGPDCIWKGIPVVCGPVGLPKATNILYRNLGDGKFADVTAKAGIAAAPRGYGLGVAAADFNNDGWPDIYVARDQTPSLLFENTGKGGFRERGVEAGVAYNADGRVQSGMGVAVADLDGNGFLDIVKTNFSGDLPSLYLNEDGRFFQESARDHGLGAHQLLGWGVAPVDVDEDGYPDLIIANGHVYPEVDGAKLGESYRQLTLLYRNLGNARFQDLTRSAGEAFQTPRPARGLAAGDLDGDGRPEIVLTNINERPTVLQNRSPRANWIRVELEGSKSNRSAIGARVTVEAGGRRQTAEVMAGGSYYSQNELALYFGLGASAKADVLRIRWPRGGEQVLRDLPANRTHRFREP